MKKLSTKSGNTYIIWRNKKWSHYNDEYLYNCPTH